VATICLLACVKDASMRQVYGVAYGMSRSLKMRGVALQKIRQEGC